MKGERERKGTIKVKGWERVHIPSIAQILRKRKKDVYFIKSVGKRNGYEQRVFPMIWRERLVSRERCLEKKGDEVKKEDIILPFLYLACN